MEVEHAANLTQSAQGRPAGAGKAPLGGLPALEADAAAAEAAEHMSKAREAVTRSPTPQDMSQGTEQQRHTQAVAPKQENGMEQPQAAVSAGAAAGDSGARAASAGGASVGKPDEVVVPPVALPDEEEQGGDDKGGEANQQGDHPGAPRCSHCGTGESSRWERNPLDKQPLCTRCRQWMRRHGGALPPLDLEDLPPGAAPVCSNCGDACPGPKQYRHPSTGRRLCGSCRMTLSRRGTLPGVASVRDRLQQLVQKEQRRQEKGGGSPSASSSPLDEEDGVAEEDSEEQESGGRMKRKASSERSGSQQERTHGREGQQSRRRGSAPPVRLIKGPARAATAAATGERQEQSSEEEGEGGEEADEEGEDAPEAGKAEEGRRLCLHCRNAHHRGRSWHTCPKTGVRWLCEPCFNKVRVTLKRAASGQGGKKRKQPAGPEEQTPEAEDGGPEAAEAAQGKGKGGQASTRPAQPPSRRKKQQQPRAPHAGDPPTPAGPDPAAAAKGRGAAAAAAAHHAAGALALLASQPASSGPGPPEPSRPLHPEASWPLQYARLQFLLADSGVAEAAAQDFKWALLGLPEMQQRMHFIELQSLHAGGKLALVKEWVARLLGRD